MTLVATVLAASSSLAYVAPIAVRGLPSSRISGASLFGDFGDAWEEFEYAKTLRSDMKYLEALRESGRTAMLSSPALAALAELDEALPSSSPASNCVIDEDDMTWTITAQMPGVKPDDFQVALDGRTLTVSGETTVVEGRTKVITTIERLIILPTRAIVREPLAPTYEEGKMSLTLPKASPAVAHQPAPTPEVVPSEAAVLAASTPRVKRWLNAVTGSFRKQRTSVDKMDAGAASVDASGAGAPDGLNFFFDPLYGPIVMETFESFGI